MRADQPRFRVVSFVAEKKKQRRKRRQEGQQTETQIHRHRWFNHQFQAESIVSSIRIDASEPAMRGSSRKRLCTFLSHTSNSKDSPRKIIAHSVSLSFPLMTIRKISSHSSSLMLACSVLSTTRASFQCACRNQSRKKSARVPRLANLVQHASHNASWPTFLMALEWKTNQ